MADRDGYPAGVPCWVDTGRTDPGSAVAFYSRLFGWEFKDRAPAGSPQRYLVAELDGRDVAAVGEQPETPGPATWNTYVWVEDADETAVRAIAAGGRVLMAPFDVGAAGRMAILADPAGASICIWQANENRGARAVNEPGAWVGSELSTSDPNAVRGFYGAVFGWELEEPDADGTSLVRLPGYGDHLARRDPELRTRLAEMRAPEGFADVVAWAVPAAQGAPPSWGVTFAVADTDATVARAAELGGQVLLEPVAAEWVRFAVLSDPEGAVFTVGQFTPPSPEPSEPDPARSESVASA